MKTIIRLLVPGYGWDTVEVNYTTNPVGSAQLYRFGEMWQCYRGDRTLQLDTGMVEKFNTYQEIEDAIVARTQGNHRLGLEADAANPRVSNAKKFNFNKNKAKKGLPD